MMPCPTVMTISGSRKSGEAQFERDFDKYVEENFDGKGVELRTIDTHELKTGFFGAWYERCGHGKCVEWQQQQNEYGAW